jgi:S-adenosylmethionine synthetase
MSYLLTSETVSEGNANKIADAISDSILDMLMADRDPSGHCNCDVVVNKNQIIATGEFQSQIDQLDLEYMVRKVVKNVGYEQENFNWQALNIVNLMTPLDKNNGPSLYKNQGIVSGYACDENDALMPAPVFYSHSILGSLTHIRKNQNANWLGPDARNQVVVEYNDDATVKRIDRIICTTQHHAEAPLDEVRKNVEILIRRVIPENLIDQETIISVNPAGPYILGGPELSIGMTGRMLNNDTYGGDAFITPGSHFSGKGPSNIERSGAYMARHIAKNMVARWELKWAKVQLVYDPGISEPVHIILEHNDSDKIPSSIDAWLRNNIDLTAEGITTRFNLLSSMYNVTSNYGHFGKSYLPWEKIDLFDA